MGRSGKSARPVKQESIMVEIGQSAAWVTTRDRPPRGPIFIGAKQLPQHKEVPCSKSASLSAHLSSQPLCTFWWPKSSGKVSKGN